GAPTANQAGSYFTAVSNACSTPRSAGYSAKELANFRSIVRRVRVRFSGASLLLAGDLDLLETRLHRFVGLRDLFPRWRGRQIVRLCRIGREIVDLAHSGV